MITINPERLLFDLDRLRKIGAFGDGVIRQAFTAADIEARRWLSSRIRDAGLDAVWDEVGNVFALASGGQSSLLIGSHSDTQPEGGWLDGAYGVICGLEIARAAREAGVDGVSAVSFADEEGAFAPLLGSRCWSGELSLPEIAGATDKQGRSLKEALSAVPEIQGAAPVSPERFRAFIEPHVEQGPFLDRARETVGVVTAIAGMRHVEIVISGEQNHAGATPMRGRRDALQRFVQFVSALNEIFIAIASDAAVWTFGQLDLHPNAVSIIPGRARAMLQIRDLSTAGLDAMVAAALELAERENDAGDTDVTARLRASIEPTHMDRGLVEALSATAAEKAPNRWRRMPSGALHDAGIVSRKLPAAMLFTPSLQGKSHSFDEDTRPEDLVFGCEVVAATASRLLS
jgi:N-carbamoyl-L-amino-acid hydrolase